MLNQLTYKPFGDSAILIEWPAVISAPMLQDINDYKNKIERVLKLQDVVVGYNSLLLVYNFEIVNFQSKVAYLKELYLEKGMGVLKKGVHWSIPVCYDAKFGIDLDQMSTEKKMSIDTIVRLHSEAMYTVFFIGFLPGFLYLGGLHKKLAMSRKDTPRLRVPKGAVAIGGDQTGVYPDDSSGGWNIIGNSPLSFFDSKATQPCFATTGDRISFKPVCVEEYMAIKEQVGDSKYNIESIND